VVGGENQQKRALRLLTDALQDPRFKKIWDKVEEQDLYQVLGDLEPSETG
jgi:hypothetical protein